ncbi:PP2C family protein-serine/threonine phosphatase [Ruania halotolerans]|uniref:PP2C family protein-serine/threonine phosphatase n=1 Tax=Ruania halotolerans TaxID=2897773 RepID=UPI001E35440E|nr:PP2C family serine/threonine-protein phosphatase [Ruania halotolerans]UFU06642.1 protein phosphatase 2C domain-containing protein [Ruania halotolerans]
MSVALRYAARSDVGLVRSVNQDSGYAGPQLLVLADGMGGPAGGDIASSVAVAHLAALDGEAHGGDDLLDQLRHAVDAAHRDLVHYSSQRPELHGLGTTVIALLRSGRKLAMVHVGDSRAYLLRAGELVQVTEDHTLVHHLVSTGQITPEEAEEHPRRSVVLRVLSDDPSAPTLDESVREARVDDRWLLCSDGLSSYVSTETIAETLRAEADPGRCADQLIDLALRAGGPDNVTIVLADVVDTTDLPEMAPQIVGAAAVDRERPTRGGSGAAARAAALTRATPSEEAGTDESGRTERDALAAIDPPEPVLRKVLRWGISAVVVLALLAGAATIGYRWSQTQYYVGTDGEHVVIYQGIPQELGPLALSDVHEVTDLAMADLPTFARSRVAGHIAATSLDEAEEIVAGLREQLPAEPSEPSEPSEDPSEDATASPTAIEPPILLTAVLT